MKDKIIDYSKKIIKNQYFLYFVFILAILNIVSYLSNSNYDAITFFIAICILIKQTTSNYAIIFITAILITNAYLLIIDNYKIISGFRSRNTKTKGYNFKRKNLKKPLYASEYKNVNNRFSDKEYDEYDMSDESIDNNHENNVETYNKMTETYNNLVNSIKKKTEKIKNLSKQIKA